VETRIVELEIRLAHQEAALQDLNAVIIRQQTVIDQLQREIETLKDRLRALTPSPFALPGDEPPPHY